jgi:hypothetical protein
MNWKEKENETCGGSACGNHAQSFTKISMVASYIL